MSPYGAALGIMMMRLMNSQFKDEIRKEGLSFIVESGPTKSALADTFETLSKDRLYENILGSITFVTKKRRRAIHLADFNAFHSRRLQSIVYRIGDHLDVPIPQIYGLAINELAHGFEMLRGTPQIDRVSNQAIFSNPKGTWIGPLKGRV